MKLSFQPVLGEDNNGYAVIGFHHDGVFVTDPFVDESSTVPVDSLEHYGVTQADGNLLVTLNETLEKATDDAANAGCLSLQTVLNIPGDFAGVYFAGGAACKALRNLRQVFAEYLMAELTTGLSFKD